MRRFLVATASLSFLLAPHAVFIESTKAHECDQSGGVHTGSLANVGCDLIGYAGKDYPGDKRFREVLSHGDWRRHGLAATQVCHRHRSKGQDKNGNDIIKKEKNSGKSCKLWYPR